MTTDRRDGSAVGNRGLQARVALTLGSLALEVNIDATSGRTAVVGPSGAGKSTLLRILAGLEPRARGMVRFEGELWMDSTTGLHTPPWDRRVGWVPQDDLLFPHLTVRENLAYGVPGSAAGDDSLRAAADLLEAGHLLDRRPPVLSGGERQRVALARALLSGPALLLLDEPFSALDRPLRNSVADRLREALDTRAIPLVLVSHDPEDAVRLGCEEFHLVEGHLAP